MPQKRKKTTNPKRQSEPQSASTRPSEQTKKGKKTGRPGDIKVEDLHQRYRMMKSFLEHHWGFFSLDLRRIQEPDEVRAIFRRVQGVEWMPPFREHAHARCLIWDKAQFATDKEIRATRKKLQHAKAQENRCWFEYNNAHPNAREATDALRQAFSTFQGALGLFPFFAVVSIVANRLGVKELNQLSAKLEKAARDAQQEKLRLEETLSAYEAHFARSELVIFVNENDRASRTLVNFARVIAGLPEWHWLYSIRKCKKLGVGPSTPEYSYQLFRRLEIILRGIKYPTPQNIERRLRQELLSDECDPNLRGYADLHWHNLRDAIYSCGTGDKRELPDKIMEKFQHNLQTPRDLIQVQLDKGNRLLVAPKV